MARPKKKKEQEEKKINENKVELAKTIAQQSQTIPRILCQSADSRLIRTPIRISR